MDVYQRRRLVALSALALIFIVFVLLIRSCGGDDSTTGTPLAGATGATGAGGAAALTVDDYIASADPICLQSNTSLSEVDETDPVQADNDKAQIVAGEVQQLQSLGQPTESTDELDKFLSELQKLGTAYQDRATAADRGDDSAVADLDTTIDGATSDVADAADAFGFKICGDLTKTGQTASGGSAGGSGGGGDTTSTDTGGTVTPAAPPVPATTTPVPTAPPADEGGTVTPAPAPAPAPTGGTGGGSSSGGVSP